MRAPIAAPVVRRRSRGILARWRARKRVAAGEITEAMALAKIREVQQRVEEVNDLLKTTGGTNTKRPLSKRCEKAMAEPASDAETVELQSRLASAMRELDAVLDREFRLTPMIALDRAEPQRA